MRRLRFQVLALVSFLTALIGNFLAPGTFINRAISTMLCTVLSFNSTVCAAVSSSDRVMAASSPNIETPFSNVSSDLKAASSALGQKDISENNSHLQAQISQTSNWILEFPSYSVRNDSCAGSNKGTVSLIRTGFSLSGQVDWTWNGQQGYATINGTINGNNVQLQVNPASFGGYTTVLNGSLNEKGEFVGTARVIDGACSGQSDTFTLKPESVAPQTIEEKRAFRKSDQQAAAELAALRERGKREGWTFEVGDSQVFRMLLEVIAGTRIPADFRPNLIDILRILTLLIQEASGNNPTPAPPQPAPNPNQLPSRFDAREWGVVPEPRSQGSCGSCWAFAGVSSQEITYSARYKQPPSSLNLSEQQLLSCNRQGYSCNGGRVTNNESDYGYESGLVTEQVYPYEGRESPCKTIGRPNAGNLYDIKGFDFILGANDDPGSSASITKIKQAIYAYGNVWAGMNADEPFQAYKGGGVFNACAGGSANHAINLIGWDDAGGYWIGRNSWGNDWGEDGYFKIKYGCNQIGVTAAVPKLPQLLNCTGGNCQPINISSPPWLAGASSTPVPPTPVQPNPVPVPPVPVQPIPDPVPPTGSPTEPLW